MADFELAANCSQVQEWDLLIRLEACNSLLKPILDNFGRDVKLTLSHLLTVHNETCGCHFTCASEMNKIWNQKKVLFMELHKLTGFSFDDFLNRALRLLLNNTLQEVEPLSESEFWKSLRQPLALKAPTDTSSIKIDDEELADIQNFILNDIVKDADQIVLASSTSPSSSQSVDSFPCATSSSASSLAVELSGRQRKDTKHLTPVDCTGLSLSYGVSWACKQCAKTHASKLECAAYRHVHCPAHVIPNNDAHPYGLPPELVIKEDGFVYTAPGFALRSSTRLGPILGAECEPSRLDFDEDRSHVWLVHADDGRRRCLVTRGDSRVNWLRDVCPAESPEEANVLLVTMGTELFMVATEDVTPDTKLRFFGREDPTTEFWTVWTQAWSNGRNCSRCSVHGQFANVADYRVHIALWHDTSFGGNPQNRIYYCPDCTARVVGAKDIVQHCRSEHASVPFRCRHCEKRFETYNSLIKHKNRIHAVNKPLRQVCGACGRVYLDAKALRLHIKQVHERSEQLHCTHGCHIFLSSKYALNRHIKEVHERQQGHACPKCHKQFTQYSNLKQHMLIHLGVKPFLCQEANCTSAFTTKQCLQVHYRKVHRLSDEAMPEIRRQRTIGLSGERASSSSASVTSGSASVSPAAATSCGERHEEAITMESTFMDQTTRDGFH